MVSSSPYCFGVVGGGLIGLGTAMSLQQTFPGCSVTVWEKEHAAGLHQSTHNSGVLHAGLYYKPGSLKATLAVSGIRQMTEFCIQSLIPHEICGKLVVATTEGQIPRLRELLDRGTKNGLQGLRWLEGLDIQGVEPHVRGLAAIHVPEEGIVDYEAVVAEMCRRVAAHGGNLRIGAHVLNATRCRDRWEVLTSVGAEDCQFLVNCAGLHCDRVASLCGESRTSKIVPFRGEYYTIRQDRQHLVRNLVYPVPDPIYPFLGVHFTRMIRGGIEAGPNAVLALSREGYRRSAINFVDALDALSFPGLWRFARRHGSMCASEILRSFSKARFCRSLQCLVPSLREEDLMPGPSGVRAQAMRPSGELVQDFDLIERGDAIHVLNAPSPGATASLAIGGHIAQRAAAILGHRAKQG
jgi:L-2-hydroxyglutarate oxidase